MGFDTRYADIEGAVVLGTVSLGDALGDAPDMASARASHSDYVRESLLREQKGTNALVGQLATIPGLPEPVRQHRFHPTRRWRFDLAWPQFKLAIELQGMKGHTRIKRFTLDSEKTLAAFALGWTVLPVVYRHIDDGKALSAISAWWSAYNEV